MLGTTKLYFNNRSFFILFLLLQCIAYFKFLPDSKELKRKQEDSINSKTFKNKRFRKKTINEEEEEEEENETFYCPKCDVIFQSLTDHAANYHETSNVLVQVRY